MAETAGNGTFEHAKGLSLPNLDFAERLSADLRGRLAMRTSRFALRDGFGPRELNAIRAAAAGIAVAQSTKERRTVTHVGPRELFIVPNEVCRAHGTGILVMRIIEQIKDPPILIRSATNYAGVCEVKLTDELVQGLEDRTPRQTAELLVEWLGPYDVQGIVCVPYYEAELRAAISAKAITRAPLTIYIMDDNTIHARGIPKALMEEALSVADLRLVISGEMRDAYESAFRQKFWIVPPLVPDRYIRTKPRAFPEAAIDSRTAVMIGNVWDQHWLDSIRSTVKGAGWRVHWYTGGQKPGWLDFEANELVEDGIVPHFDTPQAEIDKAIEESAFIVIPYGSEEKESELSKLSFPTRIPFTIASSGAPFLVVGSAESCPARFIRRKGLGEIVPYDAEAFSAAAQRLIDRGRQRNIAEKSLDLGRQFSNRDIFETLKGALTSGQMDDRNFEGLFPRTGEDFAVWVEPVIPGRILPGFRGDYTALRRLRDIGYRPDFILDIGASTGIWSYLMWDIFPAARFVLADPLHSRYPASSLRKGFEMIEAAVSDKPGRMAFQISGDLYNSSLIQVGLTSTTSILEVPVTTVDDIVFDRKVSGRGLLKVDVQYAEHLVLAGAKRSLQEIIDFVLLELTLYRANEGARTFIEMINMMSELGFDYYDDVGEWRSPLNGRLEQRDILFVRRGRLV